MSTAITFDEIERSADRTLGYALLAKAAQNYFLVLYRTQRLLGALDDLITQLTPEKIQALNAAQSEKVAVQLQTLHGLLWDFGKSEEYQTLAHVPILGRQLNGFQDRAESVSDLIDDVVLISDPSMKRLISDCAASIGL
jgi:hypothetical protein